MEKLTFERSKGSVSIKTRRKAEGRPPAAGGI